jgi:hypothetical protein
LIIFRPETYQRTAARVSEGFVLAALVLMEIFIAMIFLSRVLKYRANRWVNMVAGFESTAFAAFPLFTGKPPAFYLLLSTMEIVCTLYVIRNACTWSKPDAKNAHVVQV